MAGGGKVPRSKRSWAAEDHFCYQLIFKNQIPERLVAFVPGVLESSPIPPSSPSMSIENFIL